MSYRNGERADHAVLRGNVKDRRQPGGCAGLKGSLRAGRLTGMPADAAGAASPFEALADANRREILRLLSDGDKPVREIADAMPISRPAVSRHLRLLKDAGLVTERAQGTRRIYHLQEQGMRAVQEYLERVWGEAAVRFTLLAENTTDRTDKATGQ
jgi:DNA-binding transcriptional ArsR family regulator